MGGCRLVVSAVIIVALLIGLPTTAQTDEKGGDWSRFRGPGGAGLAPTRGIPENWRMGDGVLWRVPLPGPGGASPIVVGDRVYVTCYTGYGIPGQRGGRIDDLERHVLCLRLRDGTTVWQKTVPAAQPEAERVSEHGYASSTPASDGERLYVFLGRSGVFAFGLDGKQLWHTDVGSAVHRWGSAASPVLYGDLVIVNASVESEALVALDRGTGREAWRFAGVKQQWNTPCLATAPNGAVELVVGTEGRLVGVDPASGSELWHCRGTQGYMCPSPLVHDGVVYALWGRRTLAVRLGGRGNVEKTHQLWPFWRNQAGSNVSSPVHHNGHLYFADARSGRAYCMDGKTGAVVYNEELNPPPGQIYASPVLAEGRLYYVSRKRGVYVVAADPAFRQLAHHDLGDTSTFNASPAATADSLLLRSDKFLYRIAHD